MAILPSPNLLVRTLAGALLSGLGFSAMAGQAEPIRRLDPVAPPVIQPAPPEHKPSAMVREVLLKMTLGEAQAAMEKNKAAWAVLRITAPKNSKDCKAAKAFAKKFTVNSDKIRCLALYPATTVWMQADQMPAHPASADANGPLVSQAGDMRFVPESKRRSRTK